MSHRVFMRLVLGGEVAAGAAPTFALGDLKMAGFSELLAFEYEMERDVDSNAQIRGHVELGQVSVFKQVDAATPQIAQALARGQTVECEIVASTKDPDRGEVPHYRIQLLNGRLAGQELSAEAGEAPTEILRIAYETIQLQNLHGAATETEISWTTGGNALG